MAPPDHSARQTRVSTQVLKPGFWTRLWNPVLEPDFWNILEALKDAGPPAAENRLTFSSKGNAMKISATNLPATTRWLDGRTFRRIGAIALAAWVCAGFLDLSNALAGHREGAWMMGATAAIVFGAALVSSIAGFAFSAIAGCALAYLQVDPQQAVQSIVVWSTASQLYAVWKIRAAICWRPLWPMIAAGIATVPFGVWLLRHVDPSTYALGLGLFLTAYGAWVVLRRKVRVFPGSAWVDAATGALGGVTGGLAGLPGPFVTIWCGMRGWDKLAQRAVYQPYILVMQLATIATLNLQSKGPTIAAQDLALVPFALLGAIGGIAVFQRMSNQQFQRAVSVLLVVSGIGLLARTL
jgi:uncharacterized membrane protein YfcA